MKHMHLIWFLTIATLAACGGRAVEEPSSGGSGPSAPATSEPALGGGAGRPSSPSSPLPTHDLGDCAPGFSRVDNPNRPCNWLVEDGSCFDEKEAACACICPTSGSSVCFSGFDDGPGSATLVQCL
ncbi:MAG: hypothetical protein ABIQ16_22485 [Polyangiaceae bacterium]